MAPILKKVCFWPFSVFFCFYYCKFHDFSYILRLLLEKYVITILKFVFLMKIMMFKYMFQVKFIIYITFIKNFILRHFLKLFSKLDFSSNDLRLKYFSLSKCNIFLASNNPQMVDIIP